MMNEPSNGTVASRRIIPVGEEPPPMESSSLPRSSHSDRGEANEQPSTIKNVTGDRFLVLNRFVDFTLARLTRAELAVWLVLYRDTWDGTARVSYDDLARRVGCDRRNVGRALKRLEARGLLEVVHRGGLGRGASQYRVHGQTVEK